MWEQNSFESEWYYKLVGVVGLIWRKTVSEIYRNSGVDSNENTWKNYFNFCRKLSTNRLNTFQCRHFTFVRRHKSIVFQLNISLCLASDNFLSGSAWPIYNWIRAIHIAIKTNLSIAFKTLLDNVAMPKTKPHCHRPNPDSGPLTQPFSSLSSNHNIYILMFLFQLSFKTTHLHSTQFLFSFLTDAFFIQLFSICSSFPQWLSPHRRYINYHINSGK